MQDKAITGNVSAKERTQLFIMATSAREALLQKPPPYVPYEENPIIAAYMASAPAQPLFAKVSAPK